MVIHPLPKTVNATDIPPERLAGNTALSEQQKIAEASRQFEAMLLRQILAATQKTVIHSKLADNSTASGIYQDMITNQLADSISKSGSFGLAKIFEHQLSRPTTDDSKPNAGGLRSLRPGDAAPSRGLQKSPAAATPKTHIHPLHGGQDLLPRP